VADVAAERDADGSWPKPWWEVAAPPHLAVIGSDGLWRCNMPLREYPADIAALGELVESLGLRQVWVHQSAFARLGFPDKIYPRHGEGHVHPFTTGRGQWGSGRSPGLKHWAYWYRKGGVGFDLHIPAYGRGTWQGVDSPPELLARVAQFDHATGGVEWKGEGTITSDAFLRRRLRRSLRPTEHPPPVESGEAVETAAQWHRPLTEDEAPASGGHAGAFYIHGLDLNLAYAAGASSVPLPTGPCEHVDWPTFDANLAGVYLIPEGTTARWVTAPTFQRWEAGGGHALEGYVWPDSKRHLRAWYEMVRDARAELLEGGGAALEAVKVICHEGVGRMASKVRTLPAGKTLADDPTYQPYWAWAVIAEVRERLLARVDGLKDPKGVRVRPVAIDVDCLYFASRRSSPAALAVALQLPLGNGLGQFKPAGTCKVKQVAEALASDHTPDAIKALKAACR
jgi:hypothetical protein